LSAIRNGRTLIGAQNYLHGFTASIALFRQTTD
jgi:small ligand-binding sensory domain FIST